MKKELVGKLKTYLLWVKITKVLIVICFFLRVLVGQELFVWLSCAYLIAGMIASVNARIIRRKIVMLDGE